MRYALNALDGDARRRSVKYRFLTRVFDPRMVPVDYVQEIAILVATQGITIEHVCAMMRWHPGFYDKIVAPLIRDFLSNPAILAAAHANAGSVTLQDGLDLLITTRRCKGPPPIYGAMWLAEQWRGGRTMKDLAGQLGVSQTTVSKWRTHYGL